MGLEFDKSILQIKRDEFLQGAKLLGVHVWVSQPINKGYNEYNELVTDYGPAIETDVFWAENPTQTTMKRMRWVTELQGDETVLVEVPWDVPCVQGTKFEIPSAVNPKEKRAFRVGRMQTIAQNPISFKCTLAPIFDSDEIQRQNIDGKPEELFTKVILGDDED